MNLKYAVNYISEDEYLEGEEISDIKHEYIDGEVWKWQARALVTTSLRVLYHAILVII